MWLGLNKLVIQLNVADEYSIFRENEDRQQFFILSNDDIEELVKAGALMSKILNVPLRNELNYSYSESGGFDISKIHVNFAEPGIKKKAKRVSGVAKTCRPMIQEGKDDEEIFIHMLPKYIEAGRTEKEARELLIPYLQDMRQGKC